MTYLSNVSNSALPVITLEHPCAVCLSKPAKKKSDYCSTKCEGIAREWKHRIRCALVKLTILDFQVHFIDGITPEIYIPSYLYPFFPRGAHSFFPCTPELCDCRLAVLGDIWQTVREYLGEHLTQFIVERNMKKTQSVITFRKDCETYAGNIIACQADLYICPTCSGKFIDSRLSSEPDWSECYACSNLPIFPF